MSELIVYRITIANRSIDQALECLEEAKISGATIAVTIGSLGADNSYDVNLAITTEIAAFSFDKVRYFIQLLLHRGPKTEDSAYVTINGKNPGLMTHEDTWKHIS